MNDLMRNSFGHYYITKVWGVMPRTEYLYWMNNYKRSKEAYYPIEGYSKSILYRTKRELNE